MEDRHSPSTLGLDDRFAVGDGIEELEKNVGRALARQEVGLAA